MTEAIERVTGGCSLHDAEKPELCPNGHGHWRCVKCGPDDWDVIECHRCGKQQLTRCTFDEDFA